MVTCSDDDANPVILMWDLRNASAAEKVIALLFVVQFSTFNKLFL